MSTSSRHAIIPGSLASNRIHLVRETRIMLGADLAILYGISNFNLHKAVSRNRDRFLRDFMFRLTVKEHVLFDIPIWNSKTSPKRRRQVPALHFYRARRGHALQRTAQRTRTPSQHRHHASVCGVAPRGCNERRVAQEDRTVGTSLRCEIRSRFRCHQTNAGAASEAKIRDRISLGSETVTSRVEPVANTRSGC